MITLQWPRPQWSPYTSAPVPGVDATMVRSGFDGDYTPVATVTSGVLDQESSMEELGDAAGKRFAVQTGGASRVRRTQSEPGATSPGLSQLLTASLEVEGRTYDLRHLDAFVGTRQTDGAVAYVGVSVTCTAGQLAIVGPELGSVLESLSPTPPPVES